MTHALTLIERETPPDYALFYGHAPTYWVLLVHGQPFMRSADRASLWALAWEVMHDLAADEASP